MEIVGLEAGQPCQLLGAQDFEDVIAQMDEAALAEILKNAVHIGRREPGAVGDVLLRQRKRDVRPSGEPAQLKALCELEEQMDHPDEGGAPADIDQPAI